MQKSNICKFLERRLDMENDFMNTISVEKFAAFLDGNLLPDEMHQITSLVEKDGMMHEIYNASNLATETLSNYSEDELALPDEIVSDNYIIPSFEIDHQQLSFDNGYDVAACACADLPILDTSFDETPIDNQEYENLFGVGNSNNITPIQSDIHSETDDLFSTTNE